MSRLSLLEARALAVSAQGLNRFPHSPLEVLKQLGYVQIDAISVIERAHHHIFWTRNVSYRPDELNGLLQRRLAFEYWGHAASYLPLSDYRYYLPTMRNFVQRSRWAQRRLPQVQELLPEILQRIEAEGPLRARDFKGAKRKGGWWNWKPAKVALEMLYWQGQIMVCRREGFDKVYDLAERFLPEALRDIEAATPEEIADFCLYRGLRAHGLMSWSELNKHLPLSTKAELKKALTRALQEKSVVAVQVQGLSEDYYALTEVLESNQQSVPWPEHPLILSPFDNLVIQRERLRQLFDFDYLFEAYVPRDKRQYGYFVLPVLDRGRFVARLDCKALRSEALLSVHAWHWEPDLKTAQKKAIEKRLSPVLRDFALFNGCTDWRLSS